MLLHPALKTRFMRRAGYGPESIDQYVKEAKSRYQRHYDPPDLTRQHFQSRPTPRGGKRRRPVRSSDSDSSDGMEYNEFSSYMQIKRDSPVKDALPWWKGSQMLYPKLMKMVRDVFAVPATGAGVEREYSISRRVITKHRNRLTPITIRDLMQYKRWVVRHGVEIREEEGSGSVADDDEMDSRNEDGLIGVDEDDERETGVEEWLKEWSKRETVSLKVRKTAKQ
jgi:hypothetical protein